MSRRVGKQKLFPIEVSMTVSTYSDAENRHRTPYVNRAGSTLVHDRVRPGHLPGARLLSWASCATGRLQPCQCPMGRCPMRPGGIDDQAASQSGAYTPTQTPPRLAIAKGRRRQPPHAKYALRSCARKRVEHKQAVRPPPSAARPPVHAFLLAPRSDLCPHHRRTHPAAARTAGALIVVRVCYLLLAAVLSRVRCCRNGASPDTVRAGRPTLSIQ